MMKLYAAYGANTNIEHVKRLCPEAKVIGKGNLSGYKIVYRGSINEKYATIEKEEDSETIVLLWEISKQDELILDKYEDFPEMYIKITVPIKLENGITIAAMLYIMRDEERFMTYGNPSEKYLEIIKKGF